MIIITDGPPPVRLNAAERALIVEISQQVKSMRELSVILGVGRATLDAVMACRRSVRASTVLRVRASLLRHLDLDGRTVHVHEEVQ